MVEIYKSEGKKQKTYLVEDIKLGKIKTRADDQKMEDFINYSIRYFKVRPDKLFMTAVYVLNDEMYLDDPHKRGAKQKTAICLINKQLRHNIAIE